MFDIGADEPAVLEIRMAGMLSGAEKKSFDSCGCDKRPNG
jgi:hypothetical protein